MGLSKEICDFKVTNRDSFIEYLKLFKEDVSRNRNSENQDSVRFLEAMVEWSENLPHYYADVQSDDKINAEIPTWSQFADILMGARMDK